MVELKIFIQWYFLTISIRNSECGEAYVSKDWTHHLILDREEKFHVQWTPEEKQITFMLTVETLGYIAIGFSPNGRMDGSDIVLAWVTDAGQVVIHDRFSHTTVTPEIDAIQNIELLSGYENGTHTIISFSRLWDTCDVEEDLALGSDTVRLIWSWHPEDPLSYHVLPYHGHQRRGVRSVYLRELPHDKIEEGEASNIRSWDMRANNLLLPNDDHTHYWCQVFRLPEHIEFKKHHMIGFSPLIQPGHESYVHHMVLYECHVPGDSSDRWFAHHVAQDGQGTGGAACYSPNMPSEWAFCLATNTWAWAVGSEGETMPEDVGIPLGENYGGATYFMLETHYDNPAIHQNLVDNSGMRIYYTDQIREHDTGMLLLGTEVNFLHFIPPLQDEFVTVGRCMSQCTEKGIENPNGITILNGVLHSHLAGRKIRLRHVRRGNELPVILEDNNYDFNYQASRRPRNNTVVLPGDELLLECQYNTAKRDKPTFGGLSTREEMCLGFIWYYPRQKIADCRSLPTLETVMNSFGISEIHGKSLEKLSAFMQSIGASGQDTGNAEALGDLLEILAKETGKDLTKVIQKTRSRNQGQGQRPGLVNRPLTEEDLLKQPFYTVSEPEPEPKEIEVGLGQGIKDYRNFMSDMLLALRIKSPEGLQNISIGEHISSLNWRNRDMGERIQNKFMFGDHSSLCLAHGRVSLVPYNGVPYPKFDGLQDDFNRHNMCGKGFDNKHNKRKFDRKNSNIFLREDALSSMNEQTNGGMNFSLTIKLFIICQVLIWVKSASLPN